MMIFYLLDIDGDNKFIFSDLIDSISHAMACRFDGINGRSLNERPLIYFANWLACLGDGTGITTDIKVNRVWLSCRNQLV